MLNRLNSPWLALLCAIGFGWLCYVAWPYRDTPAKPVILHHARHTYRTMEQLLAAVELERRQDAAYGEIYGAGR